jgi:hypothetical protein
MPSLLPTLTADVSAIRVRNVPVLARRKIGVWPIK